ncbi:MAG: sensor histidine kinase [Pseudomonadota bacterium]
MKLRSLRARLIVIILAPLMVIAAIAAVWQFWNATERADGIFDRGLLSAALAISRDVAVSDGDALSTETRALVNNTSGGELFYHVFAPDGVFVTGYATPPVSPLTPPELLTEPYFFDAQYLGRDVRVLRFQDVTTVSGVSGVFTITVWQRAEVRNAFVRDVVQRAVGVIVLLVVSVAFVVWFGVGLGLRPLLDLEAAIAQRTPTELEPIRREVPVEAQGLVATLNALLDRISRRISSKDEFISNAAHQLRNPVAGVLALAEAVQHAQDMQASKKRSAELVQAARETSQLTNQLLSFERASGADLAQSAKWFSLNDTVAQAVERFESQTPARTVAVTCVLPEEILQVFGDSVMVQEALLNLMTNALVHGGKNLSKIEVRLCRRKDDACVVVKDDGAGIPHDQHIQAISRFGQTNGGPGSGLGLPIAARVLSNHGGQLSILRSEKGAAIELSFPLEAEQPANARA